MKVFAWEYVLALAVNPTTEKIVATVIEPGKFTNERAIEAMLEKVPIALSLSLIPLLDD